MAASVRRSKSRAKSVERRAMCRIDTVRNMASGEVNWPIPMKAIGAQNLLTMPGGVTISGYLHKRGGTQLQLFKWPLRYVIIHKGCVYYFKSSTSAASQGAFSLNGYNRVMRAAEETTSNNVFPFKMVHISKKHRTWYFSAASEEERKKWMLALRKEIDHYHEKKETITDLSDSGSDSDSFYGSVERPVDIKYTHSSADDSCQDEDDDEEEYVQPDVLDDSAPSYPPPPIPEVVSKPPSPPSRTYPRKSSDSYKPPVPVFPPVYKAPDGLESPTDKTGKDLKKDHLLYPGSISKKPPPPIPPQPPVHQSRETQGGNKSPLMGNNPKFKEELTNRFSTTPPVPEKPNFIKAQVLPPKPPTISRKLNNFVPPVPRKPRTLSDSMKSPEEVSPTMIKPTPSKSPTFSNKLPPLIKPPPRVDRPRLSPELRSPPDGRSFKDINIEIPVLPARPHRKLDDKSDSDDDYEKVPLPPSLFVDTCDSLDVERMFKATDARGSPLNGLFCIRNSAKAGKVLVVWDKLESKLRNYRIFQKDNYIYLEAESLFQDIASLVEHYYANTLPSHETLVLQYAYGSPSNPR
ncbi:SH3 domain-binding protein 2 isoform X1 [Engystomops pustulosus]|uniref:SH3 domain-binding protein 2 isoform X1 n=2 Tax=Engystomops pustulosus TaxID=76066 RepID=UPI003AFB077D